MLFLFIYFFVCFFVFTGNTNYMFLELTFLKSLVHGAITLLMRQHKVLQRSWKAGCNICYNMGNTSIEGILVFLFGRSAETTKPEPILVSSFHHFIIMLFSIFSIKPTGEFQICCFCTPLALLNCMTNPIFNLWFVSLIC